MADWERSERNEGRPQTRLAAKNLRLLRQTIHLEEEVGTSLDGSEILQRSLPRPTSREEIAELLTREFPAAAARDASVSPIRGGYAATEPLIEAIQPRRYASSRNFLNGAVTKLSPYIRHGLVTLESLRLLALEKVSNTADAYKFVQELAWRDYWRRLFAIWGDGVWRDREEYKTGWRDYANALPEDLQTASTGLNCMDTFARELRATGYLHNHARMWVAAYVVHWRRVRWQAGARWFLTHLLDGDPASNNLSWQWVASTFASKPYFFNRENLEKYTAGTLCERCEKRRQGCPFQGSYDELSQKLFRVVP
jgi:deoxyribodipyrimidine photo-lyase